MTPDSGAAGSAASIRARLQALSRKNKWEFQLLLAEFAAERLLYRLGVSPHGEHYVLKGAMLFKLWSDERGRATWDLDMLGRGAHSVLDVVAVVRDLCGIPADDRIVFDSDSIRGEEIRAAGVLSASLNESLDSQGLPVGTSSRDILPGNNVHAGIMRPPPVNVERRRANARPAQWLTRKIRIGGLRRLQFDPRQR